MSPITFPPADLESYLTTIGKGWVFVGGVFTAGGLALLGATEGDITVGRNEAYNDLVFPEYSGPEVHESEFMGENPVVNIPLIVGNPDLWEILSPTGTPNGGFKTHRPVITTSLVIFPESDIATSGISYSAGGPPPVWAPAAPTNAFFAYRGYFTPPEFRWHQPDGGKVVTPVSFRLMKYAANPDGHQLWDMGDPIANGGPATLRI